MWSGGKMDHEKDRGAHRDHTRKTLLKAIDWENERACFFVFFFFLSFYNQQGSKISFRDLQND